MSAKKQTESTFKPDYLHYKYYVQFGGKALGPFRMDELRKLPGFTLQTPMRRTPHQDWSPAFTVMNMKAYFSSANDAKEWSQAAARLDREKARREQKGFWAKMRRILVALIVLIIAATGVLYYLQSSGRIDERPLFQNLALHIPAPIRSAIPFLQDVNPQPSAIPPAGSPPVSVPSLAPDIPVTETPPAQNKPQSKSHKQT